MPAQNCAFGTGPTLGEAELFTSDLKRIIYKSKLLALKKFCSRNFWLDSQEQNFFPKTPSAFLKLIWIKNANKFLCGDTELGELGFTY